MALTIERTGAQHKGSSAYKVTFPNGESHVLWSSYAVNRSDVDEDSEILRFAQSLMASERRLVKPNLKVAADGACDSVLSGFVKNV